MALWRSPKPPGRISFGQKLAVGALGLGLGAKIYLLKRFGFFGHGGGGSDSTGPAWNNRRSFGGLPRRKQREIIYGKRAQLRDFENITYGGYAPLGRRRRRSVSSLFRY